MILAAGFGTRLWPLTIGRTKPAIPFLNRPLIAYTIEYLRGYGLKDLFINLHHEPDSMREQIGDGSHYGVKIYYSIEEPEILGTAGALDPLRDQLDKETFVVINGKIITDIDLNLALKTHRERDALATLVLRPNQQREHFREVIVSEEGRIEKFGSFPEMVNPQSAIRNPQSPLMFTGIHILEPEIFEYIPCGIASDSVRDVYPKAISEGRVVAAHIAEGEWFELSTLERYLSISLEFLAREGRDVVMDEDSVIEDGALVRRSVLWKRVRVERGAKLFECIVGDDVVIPAGTDLRQAAIVRVDLEKGAGGELIDGHLVAHFG